MKLEELSETETNDDSSENSEEYYWKYFSK